jgi:hypothetical protein
MFISAMEMFASDKDSRHRGLHNADAVIDDVIFPVCAMFQQIMGKKSISGFQIH